MELGTRLRYIRTASGRTIASVAADAGLSVPYIANLENNRGNPTLAALERLAEALGMRLVTDLMPPTDEFGAAVVDFTQSDRFRTEVARLAKRTGLAERAVHERLLALFVAAQFAAEVELSTLDCHRLLDVMILAGTD